MAANMSSAPRRRLGVIAHGTASSSASSSRLRVPVMPCARSRKEGLPGAARCCGATVSHGAGGCCSCCPSGGGGVLGRAEPAAQSASGRRAMPKEVRRGHVLRGRGGARVSRAWQLWRGRFKRQSVGARAWRVAAGRRRRGAPGSGWRWRSLPARRAGRGGRRARQRSCTAATARGERQPPRRDPRACTRDGKDVGPLRGAGGGGGEKAPPPGAGVPAASAARSPLAL